MKFFNVLKKYEKARFFIGMIFFGLFFAIVSVIVLGLPKAEMVETTGTIVQIYESSFESEDSYTVVSFQDENGNNYESVLNSYSSSWKVGKDISIRYNIDNPYDIETKGAQYLPYAMLAVGFLALVGGVLGTVKTIKKPSEEMNQLDRVNLNDLDSQTIEDIKNNVESEKEYYFHFCGKLNQSYILETPNRETVYKADCEKIATIKPYVFTFTNVTNFHSFTTEVSHSVTERYGNGRGISVATNSYFKIGEKVCWDYLADMGYSLDMHIDGIKMNFDLLHYGVKVGRLEAAGVNILNDDKQYALSDKLPSAGLFKVYCKKSDIEAAFFACFIASRVEIF